MTLINNAYNLSNWQLNQRTILGFINGSLSRFYRFNSKNFINLKKDLIKKFGKPGTVMLFETFTIAAKIPFFFVFALRQGMQCDWSKIFSRPAFLETLL